MREEYQRSSGRRQTANSSFSFLNKYIAIKKGKIKMFENLQVFENRYEGLIISSMTPRWRQIGSSLKSS